MTTITAPKITLDDKSDSGIKALLGPTNTGKTHRAIERMLEHGGGMMGLPLRLLAREVYDRVCAKVDARDVALITGEERIEPHRATYWICTVESMPVHKAVPFVAIDEVQLASHHERGHVFTDRILNARGTRETWFMGSDTMRPMIERLTPTARIETFERLSELSYTEPRRLGALPSRSAVIAFSVAQVYELAEWVRATQGGVAVVLGALSPKARNAQVEMFETGRVQHLVSTDAIGMGLNLDIRYVFFGALRKFDGLEYRDLMPWEIGQIAGRAGRYKRDGYFGLTEECAESTRLSTRVVRAVERQRFHPVRKIYYRNSDLDTSSVEAIEDGLGRSPFASYLVHPGELSDEQALRDLMRNDEVRAAVDGSPARTALLWEVCRIPDFRNTSPSAHARLLRQIFLQLVGNYERIDPEWMQRQIDMLDSTDGGIKAMMQRIAEVRTMAFVAHRRQWHADPDRWTGRVLELEEKLSAALHHRLTMQFVDEIAAVAVSKPSPHDVTLEGTEVVTASIPLGTMSGLSFVPSLEAQRVFGPKEVRRAGRAAAMPHARALAEELVAQEGEALEFAWGEDLEVSWRGHALADLIKGRRVDDPEVKMAAMGLLTDERRRQIREKVVGWVRGQIERVQAPLATEKASGALAGLLYVVRSQLGAASRGELQGQVDALEDADRRTLARLKVRLGLSYVYAKDLLRPGFAATRAACWAAWLELDAAPQLAPPAAVAPETDWPEDFAEAMGFPRLGPRCVRADMLERIAAHLRRNVGKGASPLPLEPMQWIGCSPMQWTEVVEDLGYEVFERDEALLARRRRRRR